MWRLFVTKSSKEEGWPHLSFEATELSSTVLVMLRWPRRKSSKRQTKEKVEKLKDNRTRSAKTRVNVFMGEKNFEKEGPCFLSLSS